MARRRAPKELAAPAVVRSAPAARKLPLPPGDDVGAADLTRRVAVNLRERRKSRALSLDELAVASGVSRAALSQIETCKTNPSLKLIAKLNAAVARYSPSWRQVSPRVLGNAQNRFNV